MTNDPLRTFTEEWAEGFHFDRAGLVDQLYEFAQTIQAMQLGACAAADERQQIEHVCSGCHHCWTGDLKGAELCGECWRKGQGVILGSHAKESEMEQLGLLHRQLSAAIAYVATLRAQIAALPPTASVAAALSIIDGELTFHRSIPSPSAPSLQEREKLSEIVDDQRVPLWSALTREFTLFGCWPRERVLAVAAQAYALGLHAALAAPPAQEKAQNEMPDTRLAELPSAAHGDLPRPATGPSDTPAPDDVDAKHLLGTIDGAVWAREFCRITGFSDEGWALAWFCNAIMAGYDEATRRIDRDLAAALSERPRTDQKDGHSAPQAETSQEPLPLAAPPEGRQDKYHELLYAVATKHPNETWHETALRYIRQGSLAAVGSGETEP